MARGCLAAGLCASLLVLGVVAPGAPAAAATTPKVVLIYGDSLVWEAMAQASSDFTAGYQVVSRALPAVAVCDLLPQLQSDLATMKPSVIVLATAGNTQGPGSCEQQPQDSPQMLADYQAALTTFTQDVAATAAQLVFVEDPPFLDAGRNATRLQIDADETQLALDYHRTSVYTAASTGFSTKTGGYEAYAKCLSSETLAEGCVDGIIPIRTIAGAGVGLHFCPDGLTLAGCDEYSSGEVRFGKYLATAAMHIPKPRLWVYGDAINWESYPSSIKPVLGKSYSVHSGAFPGSAPCDDLTALDNDLVNVAHGKPANYPKYIVLDTIGDAGSPCMIDPATGTYYVRGSDAYFAKYTQDLDAFAARAHQIGARLLFVAPPPLRGDTTDTQSQLESIEAATGDPVTYLPQQAVAPGDVFTGTLSCLSSENATQGCANGEITVRSPDGVHLCPQDMDFPNPCPVYSSGEQRWGTALSQALAAAF